MSNTLGDGKEHTTEMRDTWKLDNNSKLVYENEDTATSTDLGALEMTIIMYPYHGLVGVVLFIRKKSFKTVPGFS